MIAIVGAGISGLTLAHALEAAGLPYVILEAASRVGGAIHSGSVSGHLLEWGPQRTRNTPGIARLIQRAGLSEEVITAPADLGLLVYARGRLRRVPFSARDLLDTDLFSASAKLRILLEPFTASARDDETVARYFTRKLGRSAYADLAGPLYGGLYASDPADMIVRTSLRSTLAQLDVRRSLLLRALRGGKARPPAAISFRGGMQTLPAALARRLARPVLIDTHVESMHRDGGTYRLVTTGGDVHAASVVLTAGAAECATLLRTVDPSAADAIASLHYNPLAIVHLHRNRAGPRAFGYQVSLNESLCTRGVTFNDMMFDRKGVITAFLGGAKHPHVVTWEDESIARKAVEELEIATGASAQPISVLRTAMPAWDRTWSALEDLRLPAGIHVCANWRARPGIPGRVADAERLAKQLIATAAA